MAHQSAAVVLGVGRDAADPEITARLVGLVDELGLDTIAELWSVMPACTLPGALWRLYALREWVTRSPAQAMGSMPRACGIPISIMSSPGRPSRPAPRSCATSLTTSCGGFIAATSRSRSSARGRSAGSSRPACAQLANDTDVDDPERGRAETLQVATLLGTADDLDGAAADWRRGSLIEAPGAIRRRSSARAIGGLALRMRRAAAAPGPELIAATSGHAP